MSNRADLFLEGMSKDSVDERAAALAELGRAELEDPRVLAAALKLAGDEREAPARYVPQKASDPFASFFGGGAETEATAYTISDFTSDRLMEVGFLGTDEAANAIAAALGDEVSEGSGKLAARLLGTIVWVDEEAAVRAILPPLLKADITLFEALPGLKKDGLAAAVDLALNPYARRAVNELLNHPVAGELCYKAIQKVLLKGLIQPSEVEAMELLGLLSGWTGVAKGPAKKLAKEWPWAMGFVAFDDPDAGAAFGEWLATSPEAPPEFPSMLERAMLSRPGIEGFPLAAFLEWADGGCAVIKRWKWGGQCAPLLQKWVRSWWETGENPERAWEAVLLLLQAGEHGPVADAIAGSFTAEGAQAVPWDGKFFTLIAGSTPPIDGLTEALAATARKHPDKVGDVTPALLLAAGADKTGVEALAHDLITKAEAAEWKRLRSKRGIVHLVKDGVDVQGIEALVAAVEDEALQARLDAVWPQLLQE